MLSTWHAPRNYVSSRTLGATFIARASGLEIHPKGDLRVLAKGENAAINFYESTSTSRAPLIQYRLSLRSLGISLISREQEYFPSAVQN